MIATGLTFFLGALVALLLSLLLAPLVWRRAQKQARRDFEATIPVSANEIRAEFDRVRAEAALSVRRGEILAAEAREKSVRTQAELGRSTVENVELLKRNRKLAQTGDEREEETRRVRAELAAKDAEMVSLTQSLAASRREGELTGEELEALGARFQDLGEIAEERKIQLIAAEAKADQLSDALRAAERRHRDAQEAANRLRSDASLFDATLAEGRTAAASLHDRVTTLLAGIADRDEEILRLTALLPVPAKGAKASNTVAAAATSPPPERPRPARSAWGPSPATGTAGQRLLATLAKRSGTALGSEADAAEIRERISEIAARVIRMAALAEGPGSPIAGLVSTPRTGGAAEAGAGPPSLAERVRRLAAEADGRPPADRTEDKAQAAGTRPE